MSKDRKPSVYLETSVISYLVARQGRDLVIAAHQEVTREWWEEERLSYDLHISDVVLNEILTGDQGALERRKKLTEGLSVLAVAGTKVEEIAEHLVGEGLVPVKAANDALHIAFATLYEIDFLLTWNFKHIANVVKRYEITRALEAMGYKAPLLCSPLELMDIRDNEEN